MPVKNAPDSCLRDLEVIELLKMVLHLIYIGSRLCVKEVEQFLLLESYNITTLDF
jgi:hypothetical protein